MCPVTPHMESHQSKPTAEIQWRKPQSGASWLVFLCSQRAAAWPTHESCSWWKVNEVALAVIARPVKQPYYAAFNSDELVFPPRCPPPLPPSAPVQWKLPGSQKISMQLQCCSVVFPFYSFKIRFSTLNKCCTLLFKQCCMKCMFYFNNNNTVEPHFLCRDANFHTHKITYCKDHLQWEILTLECHIIVGPTHCDFWQRLLLHSTGVRF